MHSCVHSWTVSVLNKEWDESLAKLALICIVLEVPSNDEKDWWLLQRRLLQHALRHEQFITDGKVKTEGMEWTFALLGRPLRGPRQAGRGGGHVHCGRCKDTKRRLDRSTHRHSRTVNNLGNLYTDQGKLAEAEAMYTTGRCKDTKRLLGLKTCIFIYTCVEHNG